MQPALRGSDRCAALHQCAKSPARYQASDQGEHTEWQSAHLHVRANAEQQAQVHAHGADVGTGLTGDPEHHQRPLLVVLQQLAVVDGAHAQLALHRRNERRPLEQGPPQGPQPPDHLHARQSASLPGVEGYDNPCSRPGCYARLGGGSTLQRKYCRFERQISCAGLGHDSRHTSHDLPGKDVGLILELAQGRRHCTCAAPPEGLLCRRAMQTYSFPAPCCDFTSLVALSTHTTRLPVTLGSRVPLWPVFATLRIRRIQATTSCEEGLEGLSRLMTPYLSYKGGASEQILLHAP